MTIRELLTKWRFGVNSDPVAKAEKRVVGLQNAFNALATVIGTRVLKSFTAPAIQLESSLGNALSLTGTVGAAFSKLSDGMRNKAMDVAETLGFAGDVVADAYYQTLSTGAVALSDRFNSLTETSLKLAKVGLMAPAGAIEGLNDALNGFNLEATEFGRVADVIFKSTILAPTNIEQLVDAYKQAGPAAASTNTSLEATSAVLSLLATKGFKAAEAGTSFRRLMIRIANSAGHGAKALAKLNLSAFDSEGKFRPLIDTFKDMKKAMSNMTDQEKATNLVAIAGQFAYSQLGAILGSDLDLLQDWQNQLEEAGGSLDVAFNQKMLEAGESLKRMTISFNNFLASMQKPLLRPLAKFADAVRGVTRSARDFLDVHPLMAKAISMITTSFMVAVTVGAGLAFLVPILAAIKLPILAATLAIAGMILILEDLVLFFTDDNSKTVIGFWWKEITSYIQGTNREMEKLIDNMDEFLRGMGLGFLVDMRDWIGTEFSGVPGAGSARLRLSENQIENMSKGIMPLDVGYGPQRMTDWQGAISRTPQMQLNPQGLNPNEEKYTINNVFNMTTKEMSKEEMKKAAQDATVQAIMEAKIRMGM